MGDHITEQESQHLIEAELERSRGTWQLQYEVNDGQPTDPEKAAAIVLITIGTRYRYLDVPQALTCEGEFSIDPTKTPKEVETVASAGQFRGQPIKGIYEVVGDIKKACWAKPGRPRPTEFEAPAGSGRVLQVWKRISEL